MKCSLPRAKQTELKMTPIIDVIFLLLVFFVCTANFYPPEKVLPMDTSLPGNIETAAANPDPVNLDIVLIKIIFEDKPLWQIEGNQCSSLHEVHNILQLLKNEKADIPVIIESADDVPMEDVIDVYDVCRRVGLTDIQFGAY